MFRNLEQEILEPFCVSPQLNYFTAHKEDSQGSVLIERSFKKRKADRKGKAG